MKLNKAGLKYILFLLEDFDTHVGKVVEACKGSNYYSNLEGVAWMKDDTVQVGWESTRYGGRGTGVLTIPLVDFLSTDYETTGGLYRLAKADREKEKVAARLKEKEKQDKITQVLRHEQEIILYEKLKRKYG